MPKKKTARPEMCWIESRELWRKRITLNGKQKDIYGKTRDEVREKIKELERQTDAGMVLGDTTTLVQYAREWYPVKVANLRAKSAAVYSNVINTHLAPFFRDMKLKDIKPMHVKKLLAAKSDLSRSSRSKILYTLSQMLDSAIENGLVQSNPCKNISAGGAPSKPKIPLTEEQQKKLLEAVEGTRAHLFVLLCLYAGLRREEALGLLWSDVHLEGTPYIEVRHTVTFPDTGDSIFSDELKSKAARRAIPIPAKLTEALNDARLNISSLFVIPAVNTSAHMSLSAFRRMWEIVEKRINFYVTPHILRHTYLTELCAGGMDIKKIQYLAGHEDVTMTLRIYTHVKNRSPGELLGTIEKIFSGSSSGSSEKQASKNL